jgi:Fur family peroxide stress response transcriptional regulator
MPVPEPRLDSLVATLRKRGCRITPQRMAILRIFAESDGHPSVEQVYDRLHAEFPMTSLATVYKTVALLKEEGQILELGFAGGGSRYDGRKPYPHPHLVCLHCQRILDPELGLLADLSQELSQRYGYHIVSHRLDFYGVCPECQAADLKEGGEPLSKTHP